MKKHIISLLLITLLSTTALNAETFLSSAKQRAYASFQENLEKVQRCIYASCTPQQRKEAGLAALKLTGAAIAALGVGAAAIVGAQPVGRAIFPFQRGDIVKKQNDPDNLYRIIDFARNRELAAIVPQDQPDPDPITVDLYIPITKLERVK